MTLASLVLSNLELIIVNWTISKVLQRFQAEMSKFVNWHYIRRSRCQLLRPPSKFLANIFKDLNLFVKDLFEFFSI